MNLQRDQSLGSYNTLRLNARAQGLVTVTDDSALLSALNWANDHGLPVIPLGEGSNVVLAGDLNALVLRLENRGIGVLEQNADTVRLRVAAGERWHDLVQWTLLHGYFGLENLALIPGTVGAAPIQNIGAYGVELQSAVIQVHARVIADGSATVVPASECEFTYRDSVFKHRLRDALVITAVDLQLSRRPEVNTAYPALADLLAGRNAAVTPMEVFEAVVSIRRSKLPDPAEEPNAGSFFKNPIVSADSASQLRATFAGIPCYPQGDNRVKISAAWMIDHCGWKGYLRDGLGVHQQHALVLVNRGNNNGRELLRLADDIAASVVDTFGVALQIEPRIYGQS